MIAQLLIALNLFMPPLLSAGPTDEIVGSWVVYKLILDGVERPPFNPDLVIEFTFNEDGTSRLGWYRKDEAGFCERHGLYAFDGEHLRERITWVNPGNNADCSRDPDMQFGRETHQPARIIKGDLHTFFEVDDQTLVFVWRKITSDEPDGSRTGDK